MTISAIRQVAAQAWRNVRATLQPHARLIGGAVLIVASFIWIRRAVDFDNYVLVGNLALAGRHIYTDAPPGVNTWPPFFSLLCVPLALLARPTTYLARLVWVGVNLALLWAALKVSMQLIHQRPLRLQSDRIALSLGSPEVVIPLLLCSRFILGNFENHQINILVFACTLAGLWAHAHGRDVVAGGAIGLAAAVKVMPILFVPYFWYRGQYAVVVSTSGATIAFSLSPVLVYGWPRFLDYVAAWRHNVRVGWDVGQSNQSVHAMFDRYLAHGMTPSTATTQFLPDSGEMLPWIATAVLLAAITLAALLRFRGEERRDSRASLLEYSVVMIVGAIFGPVAWRHYFVVLLFPCLLLVGLLRGNELSRRERAVVMGGLATYVVLAGWSPRELLGRHVATMAGMLSVTTIGILVLLATLLWLRPRVRARKGDPRSRGTPGRIPDGLPSVMHQ